MTVTFRKAAALFMVLVMVFTSAPLQVLADEIPDGEEFIMEEAEIIKNEEEERIKREEKEMVGLLKLKALRNIILRILMSNFL